MSGWMALWLVLGAAALAAIYITVVTVTAGPKTTGWAEVDRLGRILTRLWIGVVVSMSISVICHVIGELT